MLKYLLPLVIMASPVYAQETLGAYDRWNLEKTKEDGINTCLMSTYYEDGSYIRLVAHYKYPEKQYPSDPVTMEFSNKSWQVTQVYNEIPLKLQKEDGTSSVWNLRGVKMDENTLRAELNTDILQSLSWDKNNELSVYSDYDDIKMVASLSGIASAIADIERCVSTF